MEEQVDIFDTYLKLYDKKSYRNIFYNFTYSEMIDHFIEYQIYEYDEVYDRLPNENEIINKFKKKITDITDIEIKKKVLPLILFLGEEFYKDLYKNDFFNDLKEFLLQELKDINFDINLTFLDKNSYQFENQSTLKKEIEELNFNTIIEFGFARSTMGNNQYVRFIYFIAEKLFFEGYCKVLNDKNSFNFLYLTNSLEWDYNATDTRDTKRRIELLKYILSKNKLILEIRFLRDLLWYTYDKKLVKNIVLNLSENIDVWKSFSNYYLNSPSRYKKLFQPLGELIVNLEKEKIDILISFIKMDRFSQDDNKKAFKSLFFNIKDIEKQKYISRKIYDKWVTYLENYQDYFSSIILTDVIDIVIYYIQEYLDKNIAIKELNIAIDNIQEIDNKWFKDISEQNNFFYKQMSKIFVYSCVIGKYSLDDIKSQIQNICDNSYLLKSEEGYGKDKTTLKLFNEYILGANDE